MARINRIEVVNYLCEGWEPSMGVATWRPLWPANLIHLCGNSTAVQIPNGTGKTSVTTAVLYLLSRDKTLRTQFLDRCAPAGRVASHIRIEFAILLDEDLTQRDLIVSDPQACPAKTYVLGVCANRGDDTPHFYRYPGIFEDAPACHFDGTTVEFVTAEALRASVRKIPTGQWGGWDTIAEWRKCVGMFMSPEVVRQNVQFHKDGAGDASATFNKITQGPGERFDEAYFRQVVAPRLLSNMMGDSAEEGERNVEDTILASMNRFTDAKLAVERQAAYLQRRQALELEFRPVIEAGAKIQVAEAEFQSRLQRLAVDAAFLTRFTQTRDGRMAGVPRPLDELSLPPSVRSLIKSMAVDKDGTVLVDAEGVAQLLDLPTGHLNQLALRTTTQRGPVPNALASAQVLDLYCDLKKTAGSGGNRYQRRFYTEAAALELIDRKAGETSALVETLAASFRAAEMAIDTNPFRHEHRKLNAKRTALKSAVREAEAAQVVAEEEREMLLRQVQERQENQGAYQVFATHRSALPAEFHEAPGLVPAWLEGQVRTRSEAVSQHAGRVGQLLHGWEELQGVRGELGLIGIADRIVGLKAERASLETARTDVATQLSTTQNEHGELGGETSAVQDKLGDVAVERARLAEHSRAHTDFMTIFGSEDPFNAVPPVEAQKRLNVQKQQLEGQLRTKGRELETLERLAEGARGFEALFGAVDPKLATPQKDLEDLTEAQRVADGIFVQHQPLAECLEQHMDSTGVEPDPWLREQDLACAAATEEARVAHAEVVRIDLELSALDDLTLVGNAEYAEAHRALEAAEVELTRVRDVILALGLPKDQTLARLSAFGPLLDAPVVRTMASAEAALAVLEQEGHEVPLLLFAPLEETLRRGALQETDKAAALGFLAGAKSRRMRAIVDPQALEEERDALLQARAKHQALAEAAERRAGENSPHTTTYRRAVQAQEAVRQGSTDKASAARQELSVLEPKIASARRLVTPEALRCLDAAVQYASAGGADARAACQAATEELRESVGLVEERIADLAPLLTPEAIVAHGGACKFVQGGGYGRLSQLSNDEEALRQRLSALRHTLALLNTKLAQLRAQAGAAEQRERDFMATYPTLLERLTRAQDFETDGRAAFMESREQTRDALQAELEALDPLRSINYAGAQAFKDHQGHDEVTLQQMIGDATSRRNRARIQAGELTQQAEGLEGDIAWAQQAAEVLHELAHFLMARLKALAPFQQDLRSREMGMSPAEAHASYAIAEEMRLRLSAWRPGEPFDLALIAPLREEVQAIDFSSAAKDVADARRHVSRAQERFIETRDAFCAKATASKDGGFSPPEIEAIREANGPAALAGLASIGSRLRSQLEEELEALAELERSAATTENASIDNLTRLIENCSANLSIMRSVMTKNPKAGFIISADIISTADIRNLMVDLKTNIEGRKRDAQARAALLRRTTHEATLGADVRRALIERIFINPAVQFHHVGMFGGDARSVRNTMSEGQKAALQMMWLIKESEYHLECTVRRHVGGGSRKKLRSRTQRVLFFDGLFSNLTERALIDEAFKGLGDPDSGLQLIGLIHNPEYHNDFSIFPSYVVGRRAGRRDVEGEHSFVRFEDGREAGTLGLAAFMLRRPPQGQG